MSFCWHVSKRCRVVGNRRETNRHCDANVPRALSPALQAMSAIRDQPQVAEASWYQVCQLLQLRPLALDGGLCLSNLSARRQ